MERTYAVVVLLLASLSLSAQSAIEALRYSQLSPGGTARGLAVGGAFGALGADYTSVTINPAAVGVYRRSEAMVSLHVPNAVTKIDYAGLPYTDRVTRVALGNVGIVGSKLHKNGRRKDTYSKWVATNFAFGFNRIADYNTSRYFRNEESYNSFLAEGRSELNGQGLTEDFISTDLFGTRTVAYYNTFLLNPVETGGDMYSAVTDGAFVDQQVSLRTRGSIDELTFALGGNYNEKLFIGALIGVPFLKYNQELVVSEADDAGKINGFERMALTEKLTTNGVGINARFGIIARVHKYIRLGASVHTPTRYGMSDSYSTEVASSIDTLGDLLDFYSGEFDYTLSTPARFVGSAAFLIKTHGFVSIDYEYADYRMARYQFANQFKSAEVLLNQDIDNDLTGVHTLRLGAEAALGKFRLRGGYAYSTTPLSGKGLIDADYSMQSFSGGAGIKLEKFYIDAAYVRSVQNSASYLAENVAVKNNINKDNIVLTVGFNF